MENAAGDGGALGVDELWRICEKPAVDWNLPLEIGRLRHLHVTGVGGQVHRADAYDDGVAVDFLLELDAFGYGVMHAALHEAAVLHVVHVVGSIGGFVLGQERGGREQACQEEKYCSHDLTLVRFQRSALLHHSSISVISACE